MQEVEAICDRVVLLIEENWPIKKIRQFNFNRGSASNRSGFDYKIEEQLIAKIESGILQEHSRYDLGINVQGGQKMRPAVLIYLMPMV
jgi:hypothetical protein